MKLEDIPPPELSDGTKAIKVEPGTIDKVLVRCEELGWLWASGHPPTKYIPKKGWLLLGSTCEGDKKYLLYNSCALDRYSQYYIFEGKTVSLIVKPMKALILKNENTKQNATNCASCGGKLKDPGMGPLYKHCPKCEP
jgi:hypothetical protein